MIFVCCQFWFSFCKQRLEEVVLCHLAEEDDAFSFVNWFSVLLGKYVFKDVKKSQMPLKYCSLHSCIAHYANKQTAVIGGSIGMENIDWWNQN